MFVYIYYSLCENTANPIIIEMNVPTVPTKVKESCAQQSKLNDLFTKLPPKYIKKKNKNVANNAVNNAFIMFIF